MSEMNDRSERYTLEGLYEAVFSQDPKITFELRQKYRLLREKEEHRLQRLPIIEQMPDPYP